MFTVAFGSNSGVSIASVVQSLSFDLLLLKIPKASVLSGSELGKSASSTGKVDVSGGPECQREDWVSGHKQASPRLGEGFGVVFLDPPAAPHLIESGQPQD